MRRNIHILHKNRRNMHYNNRLKINGGKIKMNEEISIIIADDNKTICKFMAEYLQKYEEIKILGIANTDEEEIQMIEELKPQIVITDLMRNHKYTGLDIIKDYSNKNNSPKFLVISADAKEDVIKPGIEVAGYISKGIFFNYEEIVNELKRIKRQINTNK